MVANRAVIAEASDDPSAKYAEIATSVEGLTLEHAVQTPYLLVGAVDEIVNQIIGHGERWGITYFGVRTLDEFGPVIRATSTRGRYDQFSADLAW